MTLLKVYSKNGHFRHSESPEPAFPGIMNYRPLTDYYTHESRYGSPRVNIKELPGSYTIEMEVPGIDKNLLKMKLDKDMLSISYQNDEEKKDERFTFREFTNRNFERTFRIPESVTKDKITANCSNGILFVNLPKNEDAVDKGPRSIEIS